MSVSQDKLSLAVQLARRDIKKQKEDEEMEKSLSKLRKSRSKTKGQDSPRKAKIIHSREYKERMKKRQEREHSNKVGHIVVKLPRR